MARTEFPEPRESAGGTSPGSRRYGCLGIALAMVALAMVGLYFGLPHLMTAVLQNIEARYTESEPRAIPAVAMPAAARESLLDRVREFARIVQAGEAPATLQLDANECNALIAYHEDLKELRDRVFVALHGDRMTLEFCFPSVPELTGRDAADSVARWWNGQAVMQFDIVDGAMESVILELELGEETLVDASTQATARHKAQIPFLAMEHDGVEQLEKDLRLERFEVKDGRLHLRVAPKK